MGAVGMIATAGSHVGWSLLGRAAGMFAVTNIDDLLVLAVFFGRAAGRRSAAWGVVAGQYLGFLGIVAASVLGALGAGLLPEAVIPYLGLLPIALGLRAGWTAWRDRRDGEGDEPGADGPGVGPGAAGTVANGGGKHGGVRAVSHVAG